MDMSFVLQVFRVGIWINQPRSRGGYDFVIDMENFIANQAPMDDKEVL